MRKIIYKIMQLTLRPFALGFIKELHGIENVPKDGSYLVASNHESYIDPVIIKAIFEKHLSHVVYYMVRKDLYKNLLKGAFFDASCNIPLERGKNDTQALQKATDRIKENGVVGIFPEGTRSRDGNLHRGKTGAVRIALAARCPILPVGINKTFELWPPHKKLFKYKKEVIINIGKPISLEEYYNKKITRKSLREITDTIMRQIAKLSNQKYVE